MEKKHWISLFLLREYFTIICAEMSFKEVKAVDGQVAFIPCEAADLMSRNRSKPTLLRWYQTHYHRPIYTLDLREVIGQPERSRSFEGGRHFPIVDYEGRLYFDVHADPVFLRIDPVLSQDAGTYTCRIDFVNQRSVSSSKKLEVIVPPKGVIIHDQFGKKIEGVIGPFKLGDSITMTCESIEGRPSPVILWKSDLLDDSKYSAGIILQGSTIIITSLERKHQWSHYTCVVQNTDMAPPLSSTIIIELFLPPIQITTSSHPNLPFNPGDQVLLSCQSVGSHPKAQVVWTYNGKVLTSDEKVSDHGNVTTSMLQINVTPRDHGKAFNCMVSNPSVPSLVLRKSFILNVQYRPQIKVLFLHNGASSVKEGSNITLLCKSDANPAVRHTIWKFERNTLQNSTSMVLYDEVLHIFNFKKTHVGKYTCIAINKKGSSSSSVYINMKHTPECRDQQESSSELNAIPLNVTCNLSANPANVTYYWMLRNSTSNHSWSTGRVSDSQILWPASELICWGSNEIGMQSKPCIIFVKKGTTKRSPNIYLLLVECFAVASFITTVFVLIRKLMPAFQSSSAATMSQLKQIKGKRCDTLLSECVKTTAESDCSRTLLKKPKEKECKSTGVRAHLKICSETSI